MWLARCPPEAKRSAPDTGTVSAVETVAESGTAVKRVTTMLRTRDTTTGTDHDVASGSWEGAHIMARQGGGTTLSYVPSPKHLR